MTKNALSTVGAAVVATATLATLATVAPTAASPAPPPESPSLDRTETPYGTTFDQQNVAASVVTLHIPLPEGSKPHPEQCDRVSYLRFRNASGPTDPNKADRILVSQPGVLEGAGAYESVARNTVTEAASQGKNIEVWAMDRRSNCLEDHTGFEAGRASGDVNDALDYYVGGKEKNGRTFDGFGVYDGGDPASPVGDTTVTVDPSLDWLNDIGLDQTLRDQYDIMRSEVPDLATRQDKMLCGGHSLGGYLSGYFAEWDFDGDPSTTDDAGFNQCGGYFALDTVVDTDLTGHILSPVPVDVDGLPAGVGDAVDTLYGAPGPGLPVFAAPSLINPETMNLLGLIGMAANDDPDGLSAIVPRLPDNANIESTMRVLLGGNPVTAVTGEPDIRSIRVTNDAVLGALLDDNSMPFGILQSSVGFIDGPVVQKTFPVNQDMADGAADAVGARRLSTESFGDAPKYAPAMKDDSLYRWVDYDEDGGLAPGQGPETEVTSIHDLARSLSEPPLDFTEWYFPSRLATEMALGQGGPTDSHRLYRGAYRGRPTLTFTAQGGIVADPPEDPANRTVFLPGYNHLDALTANARQNTGEPEAVSTNLAGFAVTGRP